MITICIPFRDRGRDPLRRANLDTVLKHWAGYDVLVVDDGRIGDAQFNRSAAYNRAASQTDSEVLVFSESDMLLDHDRLNEAIDAALERPGLVVPFTERHELNAPDSQKVRDGAHPRSFRADVVMPKPRRTGAINVLTRETLTLVGRYDEAFEGSWWDDRSMHIAFDMCAGPTRWIDGPSWHLYHLPGYSGTHLTREDKQATARNKARWRLYTQATTPDQIRALTEGGH